MMSNWRALLVELIGTFMLVFIGITQSAANGGALVAALAHGLVVVSVAYTYGHISGAHLNPAVTLGLLIGRHIDPVKAGLYMVAQLAGGILAAVVAIIMVGIGATAAQTTGSLTNNNIAAAVIVEALMTFILVSAVYQTAVFGKAGNFAGLAIGLTLTACILGAGALTGASLNPARTLGPAIVGGQFGHVIPYLLGIFGGGALAAAVQQYAIGNVKS
jgi:MIP family channel proteins